MRTQTHVWATPEEARASLRGVPVDGDDDPNLDGEHHGSAYQNGWYGYAQKDLRRLLGRRVHDKLSRVYCGGARTRQGNVRKCRARLRASLKRALNSDPAVFYRD